jgi:hypothetical protein
MRFTLHSTRIPCSHSYIARLLTGNRYSSGWPGYLHSDGNISRQSSAALRGLSASRVPRGTGCYAQDRMESQKGVSAIRVRIKLTVKS